jgi:hypothetical protein
MHPPSRVPFSQEHLPQRRWSPRPYPGCLRPGLFEIFGDRPQGLTLKQSTRGLAQDGSLLRDDYIS